MDAIVGYDVQRIKTQEFVDDFSQLLRQSWFFRTWTIQEFVLIKFPPRIQCGTRVVTSGQVVTVRTFLAELRYHTGKVKDDVVLEHSAPGLTDLRSAILDGEGTLQAKVTCQNPEVLQNQISEVHRR